MVKNDYKSGRAAEGPDGWGGNLPQDIDGREGRAPMPCWGNVACGVRARGRVLGRCCCGRSRMDAVGWCAHCPTFSEDPSREGQFCFSVPHGPRGRPR